MILQWTHVSNLQYWNDPIAKAYQVRGIRYLYFGSKRKNNSKNLRGSS